jgi:hypothetical protein
MQLEPEYGVLVVRMAVRTLAAVAVAVAAAVMSKVLAVLVPADITDH